MRRTFLSRNKLILVEAQKVSMPPQRPYFLAVFGIFLPAHTVYYFLLIKFLFQHRINLLILKLGRITEANQSCSYNKSQKIISSNKKNSRSELTEREFFFNLLKSYCFITLSVCITFELASSILTKYIPLLNCSMFVFIVAVPFKSVCFSLITTLPRISNTSNTTS